MAGLGLGIGLGLKTGFRVRVSDSCRSATPALRFGWSRPNSSHCPAGAKYSIGICSRIAYEEDNLPLSKIFHFWNVLLPRDAMLTRYMLSSCLLSVRLSVCPSVTSRCSTKTAKRRITQTTTHDSPWL